MSNDGVAKLSPFTHETCRLSDCHVEGVEAVRHLDDATGKSSEFTLSHAPAAGHEHLTVVVLRARDDGGLTAPLGGVNDAP